MPTQGESCRDGWPAGNDVNQLAWTLSLLRPYRARVVMISILALLEIGLGALAPWPLKVVVDNVLGGQRLPEPLALLLPSFVSSSTITLLLVIVVAGLLLQIAAEVTAMMHTQIQVDTGQRPSRSAPKPLVHLQAPAPALRRRPQIRLPPRSDAYCVSDLVLGGSFRWRWRQIN
jgi:hypothetical protein